MKFDLSVKNSFDFLQAHEATTRALTVRNSHAHKKLAPTTCR